MQWHIVTKYYSQDLFKVKFLCQLHSWTSQNVIFNKHPVFPAKALLITDETFFLPPAKGKMRA
ncbi:hypothetical protein BED30_02350 [Citrobacter portucalensis]|nr:hypothetical protein BED30_02350 [Citrobacter portucalensis]